VSSVHILYDCSFTKAVPTTSSMYEINRKKQPKILLRVVGWCAIITTTAMCTTIQTTVVCARESVSGVYVGRSFYIIIILPSRCWGRTGAGGVIATHTHTDTYIVILIIIIIII